MNSKKDKRKEIHRHMIVKISKTEDKKKKNLESLKSKMIDQFQGNSNKIIDSRFLSKNNRSQKGVE